MSDKLLVRKPSQWACRTPVEAKAMTDWVNAELDRMDAYADASISVRTMHEEDKWRPDSETPDWAIAMMNVGQSIEHADNRGDIEPVRKDLLHLTGHDLARFLKPPKRKRGKKFSKDESNDLAKKAASEVLP